MTKTLAARHLRKRRAADGIFNALLDFKEPELSPRSASVVCMIPGNDLVE